MELLLNVSVVSVVITVFVLCTLAGCVSDANPKSPARDQD